MKMDVDTLNGNIIFCDEIDDKYKGELTKLLEDKRYETFYDVIRYMIERGVRLEQEVLL